MKKMKLPLLISLCLCFIFSGCSTLRFSSIDDLISPISPSGDEALVQRAVDEYCKSGYSIKIASSGGHTSSYIFSDLDNDKKKEAIAFYEPNDSLGTINMAVLKEKNNNWSVIYNLVGDGSDVSSVEFSDLNNDERPEIIVSWKAISKSSNYNLCVYEQGENDGKYSLKMIGKPVTAGEFVSIDLNEDGVNELVILSVGTSSTSPKAKLYSYNKRQNLIGDTKLDSRIVDFEKITVGNTDEGPSIYVDAICTGEKRVTEFLYWSNYYKSIVSPFYSYNTTHTSDTIRNNNLNCADIDDDKEIEIPLDKSVKGLSKGISCQNWVIYKKTVLNHKAYSYCVSSDSYYVVLNNDEFKMLTPKYDSNTRELIFYNGKEECFRILTAMKSSFDSDSYNDYSELFSDSGFVYLARVNKKCSVSITIDDLKNKVKTY